MQRRRTLLAGTAPGSGLGHAQSRRPHRALPHASGGVPRLAHGTGRLGISGAMAQSIASGCTFEDAVQQQDKMREAGAGGDHHRRPALPRSAARDFRSADRAFRAGRRRTAAIYLLRRGRHAPPDALRNRRGGAAVGRPGARRADHRQRDGARHRHRGPQRRARRRRRNDRGAGVRRGYRLPIGESQACRGDRRERADRLRVPDGLGRLSAELSRSATGSSAA